MKHAFVKGAGAVAAAVGLVLSSAGVALPAGKPFTVKVVAVFNQQQLVAQGLSPAAALQRARKMLPYNLTSARYIPGGFRMTTVVVFPFMPGQSVPSDTETYQVLMPSTHGKLPQARTFEVDHQGGEPYVYLAGAFFTLSTVKLGSRTASVAEQQYRDPRTHKSVDLLYVYWYDRKLKVATEVTADLLPARLSKQTIYAIAASIR